MNQHTYVICAYKESPFLEECIRSLKAQTVQSEIIMATSTPNDYIRSLADEYEIPLFVNSARAASRRIGIMAMRRPIRLM